MSEAVLGTLYDLNKSIMQKQEKMSEAKVNERMKSVKRFFSKGTFFMLLCHERRDYTIFQLVSEEKYDVACTDLKECLDNRGEILSIEPSNDGLACEIWIKPYYNTEAFAYYLFPYDEAVIVC